MFKKNSSAKVAKAALRFLDNDVLQFSLLLLVLFQDFSLD